MITALLLTLYVLPIVATFAVMAAIAEVIEEYAEAEE
jgi:hypothetical protein